MKKHHGFKTKLIEMMLIILISLCGGVSYAKSTHTSTDSTLNTHAEATSQPAVVKSRNARQRMDATARKNAAQHFKAHYKQAHEQHILAHAQKHQGFSGKGQGGLQ